MSALRTELDDGRLEVVGVVKDITERKQAEAELLAQARTDALTGLPNRATLTQYLRQALRGGTPFSLFLVDLEGFKDINYTLGHPVGDGVLGAVAGRLSSWLPAGDILARSDGDEFAIVVYEPWERAQETAAQLLHVLHQPVAIGPVTITIRASAGIACAPGDGGDADSLLRRAASAMYTAKRHRTGAHRYHQGDDEGAARRLELAGRLPAALGSGEIEVHYQPTVELMGGQCEVLEALVRWRHPVLGAVPPSEFVPLAEQYGLSSELLRRVLAEGLAQCKLWRAQGLAQSVAVNTSPRCLLSPGFVASISAELARAGLPADALVLELTEDAFAFDAPGAYEVLCQLNEIGTRTAIDDFGTGYSSLSYLRQLPVDAIKLDRSFVSGLGRHGSHDAVVAHTVELGHELGLKVIAEGVETATEMDAVRYYNCDVAQGFWLCRPAPAADITGWLMGRSAAAAAWSVRSLGG